MYSGAKYASKKFVHPTTLKTI